MKRTEARAKLLQEVTELLPKIQVNNGHYDMIFTDGYMMIWKYIRDYAKAIDVSPRNIKKGGRLDPIFTYMNTFMYPPRGSAAPSISQTAELIVNAADDHIKRAERLAAGSAK